MTLPDFCQLSSHTWSRDNHDPHLKHAYSTKKEKSISYIALKLDREDLDISLVYLQLFKLLSLKVTYSLVYLKRINGVHCSPFI